MIADSIEFLSVVMANMDTPLYQCRLLCSLVVYLAQCLKASLCLL